MRNQLPFLCLLCILLGSCSSEQRKSSNKAELRVAAAANVQFAMEELEAAFEEKSAIDLQVIISSSGKLTAQIEQGAPYDVLISANMKYPEALYARKMATAPPKVYAFGALVLWTMYELELDNWSSWVVSEDINKVALANPKNAPYGEAAITALKRMNLYDQVEPKLVYGENIAQTNQYILSKACNLGFTAKSVVLSPQIKDKGKWVELDASTYEPIKQGVVITAYGAEKHPDASQQFFEFLFSNEAKEIFVKYGYVVD